MHPHVTYPATCNTHCSTAHHLLFTPLRFKRFSAPSIRQSALLQQQQQQHQMQLLKSATGQYKPVQQRTQRNCNETASLNGIGVSLCIDRVAGGGGSGGSSGGSGRDAGVSDCACRCERHQRLNKKAYSSMQALHHRNQQQQQQQQRQQQAQQSQQLGGSRLLSRAKIKAVFMSLCVVIAFLLCWLPYFVAIMVNVYSDGRLLSNSLYVTVSAKLVLLHSVLNPILYFMFATRSTLVAGLCASCVRCCKCCCRLSNEASIYAPSRGASTRLASRRPQRRLFAESSASYDMLNNHRLQLPPPQWQQQQQQEKPFQRCLRRGKAQTVHFDCTA